MSEPTRQPLLSEAQVRMAFIASGVGMVALLVLILILATARPQGDLSPADTTQYEASLARASADLEGYELLGDGRATIDINRAIDLVVERGVDLEITSSTAPAPATATDATSDTAADATAAGDAAADEAAAADEPVAQAGGPQRSYDVALGEQTYANCQGCHQANGAGLPPVFPPLADHLPDVFAAEGGRSYLANTLLYGVQGQIQIDGRSYNGVMPAWAQLSDAQIAAVLNHALMSWGNADLLPEDADLYTPDDIAAERGAGRSPTDVYALRQELDLP